MSLYGFSKIKKYYITGLIMFIVYFILCIIIFCSLSNLKKDYEQLYDQAKILEEDFSQIFFMENAEYCLNNEKMTVTLSDGKIHLELTFNKELNKVEEDKKINNISIKDIIFLSFEISMMGAIISIIIIYKI